MASRGSGLVRQHREDSLIQPKDTLLEIDADPPGDGAWVRLNNTYLMFREAFERRVEIAVHVVV
jgi:hypothetical protein